MGKIYKERNEKDLPDNFLDIVNCVEIDTKYLKKHFDEEQKIKFNEEKKQKAEYFKNKESLGKK